MHIYYKDGKDKSEVLYDYGQALEWTDYYSNGNVEFEEEYHRSFEYLLKRNTYYENGDPEQTLELDKKKNLIYDWAEYFENGQVKTQGKAQFDNGIRDYVKIGEWNVYDKDGNLEKRLNYVHGKSSEIKIEE
jgi:antitoxin component YwqK of YwqJK toxin-antitoxin module